MNKLIITIAVIATLAGGFAHAEDKKPDTALTFNGYGHFYKSPQFSQAPKVHYA